MTISRQAADLLIEARWVLPIAPRNIALAQHGVVIDAGRIVAVGPVDSLIARYSPREHVARPEHVLLPGFVNAHTRVSPALTEAAHGAAPEDLRDLAQLAIATMLRAGITTFATTDARPDEVARIIAASRVRAAVGLPVSADATRVWDEYRSNPWVSLYFAPSAAAATDDATLRHLRTVADELDARIALPLKAGAVTHLNELGLLRPGFSALQPGELDEAELTVLARTGSAIIACPEADVRTHGGSCAPGRVLAHGIALALGSGSPALAAADMLAQARAAALLSHLHEGARQALSAAAALQLATQGGASVLGLGALVGTLEPGKAADLISIDLSSLGPATDLTAESVADALVYRAVRDHVRDVWIAGRPAVADRQLLTFDEAELRARAEHYRASAAPRAASGAGAR
ncbi:MAG TPA: amidohydrolase family protein [Steroidobacteraceae bacterium]|nr:amidohydrolase family protein [Steroidobacteraceae bacterium]